jgi:hypothetical protein
MADGLGGRGVPSSLSPSLSLNPEDVDRVELCVVCKGKVLSDLSCFRCWLSGSRSRLAAAGLVLVFSKTCG